MSEASDEPFNDRDSVQAPHAEVADLRSRAEHPRASASAGAHVQISAGACSTCATATV